VPPIPTRAVFVCLAFVCLAFAGRLFADVSISELDDRISVKIDGQIFTEWRHKEWTGPFLYPVTGPNGENITRHFPMKEGLPGEDPDHPHHRSIRFSHSDVNGFNFWWAPAREKAGHTAEVKLEKVERISSGKTGEIVLWNQWLGDGKLVLREKVRLAFTPLENRQVLMDYDIDLQAADAPVVFGDKRDGGMLVRVAGTMKVESEKGVKGEGVIVNSRGDRNADAWGKRAEWTDYFGPDASGRTVGIAMFDHPANLRFPTHWHARTYGLMTANRFGTDHFKGNYNDHKTVICAPAGANCPACLSHSGDYTIPAGKSIALRHRFFFHHGDPVAAGVVEQYRAYTADPESVLGRMRALQQDRKWKEVIEQFAAEDFTTWPAENAALASEALQLRGMARSVTKDGRGAEADLKLAVKLAPQNVAIRLSLADNYVNILNDDESALAVYRQALAITGASNGWQPLTATVSIARILTDQVKPDEAIAVLQTYGNIDGMAPTWRVRFLRAYGHAYAAQGREQESLAKFHEALQVEPPK
jgi:predicted negative regulator of RcsB-dependent stress response